MELSGIILIKETFLKLCPEYSLTVAGIVFPFKSYGNTYANFIIKL